MNLSEFSALALPNIRDQMEHIITLSKQQYDNSLFQMLNYTLGWEVSQQKSQPQGKRIRPLILLLATETSGGNWRDALPAAAAIELIHNFSLIHDDIEDQSDQRRGKPTLWKIYGIPLALNAGDALFTLSFICLQDLIKNNSTLVTNQAISTFSDACLSLTKGQHLDISFENLDQVSVSDYLEMIEGKTASLIAASSKIGALIGGADQNTQNLYFELGKNIGLAFQILDDILGIWGDPQITGKSAATDLLTRKKSLPILYGLSQSSKFRAMWESEIVFENVTDISFQLKKEGAYDFSLKMAEEFTSNALEAFKLANPSGNYCEAFLELITSLTNRKS